MESDPFEECVEFMINNRYDILPLKDSKGIFNYFLVTDEWNHFNNIRKKHKSELPKLRADCDFISLVKAFTMNKEKYFLLYKGARIVGLISIVNFSFREIYVRLYNELAELEIKMVKWLFRELTEAEIIDILLRKNNSETGKSALGQFFIDQKLGNDNSIREYLYLSSLHCIIKEKQLYTKLGYNNSDWKSIATPLFNTRNSVAHPVRSIIREQNDFKRVLVCLETSKKIKSKLHLTK